MAVERLRPEDVATADELWLRTVDQAIEGEKGTYCALQEHVSEIDETISTLRTLHEQIYYTIMVPYGQVAMFQGQMVRTNEVHVRLSTNITVHTSTKHAQSILSRRRDYTVEKQDLVQKQIDALESRRIFAQSEKQQDGQKIEEIVEAYDENVHGPLDGPMVRDEVHASRKYYGPPRNEEERLAHEADMQALRQFVALHAEGLSARDIQQSRLGHSVAESTSPRSLDSDDEHSTELAAQPSLKNSKFIAQQATPLVGGPQLEVELDRLVAAFEGAEVMQDGGRGSTKDVAQAVKPLIQEITNRSVDESTAASATMTSPARESSMPQITGLKHGFFNQSAKPKKGILKKLNEPATAEQLQHVSGPQVSSALAQKNARTAAEMSAFSGIVKERPQAAAVHGGNNQRKAHNEPCTASPGLRKVSKFKSQRAAAAFSTPPDT